ncbi:variant leucine-rich repeat-containing protein [Gulosibacter sp. ACHW.36C]|uniref:Leucine rich repeat variant domain-containing protein n=1 Tax=Gulosibacter sediminis TaxID=1729695 RepID=A0ABY4N0J1_9MICO|nr:hypothetical protein [Gulosibacter sediminis]UQN15460.1 hypothetical protein M3M28_03045 [Gulosibacter sediminis]
MTDREPGSFTAEELASPSTDAATLARAAAVRPDLWSAILANPNCYPELGDWIRQQQGVQNVPPAQQQNQHGQQQAQPGQQQRQPDQQQGQYGQQQNQYGQQQGQPGQQQGGTNQFFDGAQQMAQGAKSFLNDAGQRASKRASDDPNSFLNKFTWGQVGVVIAAVVGFIGLFLPAVSASAYGFSVSASFIQSGDGVLLLILFLGTIGLTIFSGYSTQRPVLITSWVVALIAGVVSVIDAIATLANVAGSGFGPGLGIFVVLLVGLAIIAGTVLDIMQRRKG